MPPIASNGRERCRGQLTLIGLSLPKPARRGVGLGNEITPWGKGGLHRWAGDEFTVVPGRRDRVRAAPTQSARKGAAEGRRRPDGRADVAHGTAGLLPGRAAATRRPDEFRLVPTRSGLGRRVHAPPRPAWCDVQKFLGEVLPTPGRRRRRAGSLIQSSKFRSDRKFTTIQPRARMRRTYRRCSFLVVSAALSKRLAQGARWRPVLGWQVSR